MITDEAVFVPLRNRAAKVVAYAIVSPRDEWVLQHRWCLSNDGYARRCVVRDGAKRNVSLHREILGLTPSDPDVDHINRSRLDNRRCNLRFTDDFRNQWNRDLGRGYCWSSRQRAWLVRQRVNGRQIYIGYFREESAARLAVAQFRAEHDPNGAEQGPALHDQERAA